MEKILIGNVLNENRVAYKSGYNGNYYFKLYNFNPSTFFKHYVRHDLIENINVEKFDDISYNLAKFYITDLTNDEEHIYGAWEDKVIESNLLKDLKKYCQCKICRLNILNITRYFYDRDECGCLHSINYSYDFQRTLYKTIKYRNKQLINSVNNI